MDTPESPDNTAEMAERLKEIFRRADVSRQPPYQLYIADMKHGWDEDKRVVVRIETRDTEVGGDYLAARPQAYIVGLLAGAAQALGIAHHVGRNYDNVSFDSMQDVERVVDIVAPGKDQGVGAASSHPRVRSGGAPGATR